MKKISLLFCAVLSLCLTACMVVNGPLDASGVWTDEQGRTLCLDEDGMLGLPGQTATSGVRWTLDDGLLTLTTLSAPGDAVEETRFTLKTRRLSSLELLDEQGKPVIWKKSRAKVTRLEGTLFYRERMMLPPDIVITARLDIDGNPAASSLVPASGREELTFRLHLLDTDAESGRLSAAVYYGREKLLATPQPMSVRLNEKPAVLLHHAIPEETQESTLTDTYWRLTALGGKPAQFFPDQPEAHLILKDDGQASGSDGCNNFFLSWKAEGQKLAFGAGGSTLRLCPAGEEQAASLMKALSEADAWSIEGRRLELFTKESVSAVFEAVDIAVDK